MNDNLDGPRQKAADALRDLAVAMLTSDKGNRFLEAKKICEIGHALLRSQAKRVEDFADEEDGGNRFAGFAQAGHLAMPLPLPNRNAPLDQNEIFQNLLHSVLPQAQMTTEARRAEAAAQEATELATLTDLLPAADGARRVILQGRIQTLMDHMEARSNPEPTRTELVLP